MKYIIRAAAPTVQPAQEHSTNEWPVNYNSDEVQALNNVKNTQKKAQIT